MDITLFILCFDSRHHTWTKHFPKPIRLTGWYTVDASEIRRKRTTSSPFDSIGFSYYIILPIGSMYAIFTYIYHKNHLHVGKYTTHGSYGLYQVVFVPKFLNHQHWNVLITQTHPTHIDLSIDSKSKPSNSCNSLQHCQIPLSFPGKKVPSLKLTVRT